ncbi:DUF3857 domain-containing protein, partial [candidate division KSB1 bacterium]|nr:DUF3857 domain-containing protein [candidate division KSB1 bacterium]
ARTYMADGKIVDCQANAINLISPFELERAPDYLALQQWVVTHLGVERLATLVLEYEIIDSVAAAFFWGHEFELQTDKPILEQTINILVPKSQKLVYATPGCDFAPVISETAGQKQYTFSRRRVPYVPVDQNNAQLKQHLQRLIFSTQPDWSTVKNRLREQFQTALNTSPALHQEVQHLTGELLNPVEKVAALHQYVVNQIQSIQWPLADFGFQPRPAARVYETGYGHVLDKAVLLTAMLQEIGLQAEIGWFAHLKSLAPDVPTPLQLPEIWVKVVGLPQEFWLAPDKAVDQKNQYQLNGYHFLSLTGPQAQPVVWQLSPPVPDDFEVQGKLKIEPTEKNPNEFSINGKFLVTVTGRYNFCAFRECTETQIKKFLDKWTSNFGELQFASTKVMTLEPHKTIVEIKVERGKLTFDPKIPTALTVPIFAGSILSQNFMLHRQKRQLALAISGPLTEKMHLELELPKGLKVAYWPENFEFQSTWGLGNFQVGATDSQLTIRRLLQLKSEWLQPQDYPDFRARFTTLLSENQNLILLESAPNP